MTNSRPRVFTWHVHGNYLLYLTQTDCDFYIPYNDGRTTGYAGKTPNFPFGDNVHEVHVSEVNNLEFDCIIFQDDDEYLNDQYEIFSEQQRKLPKIYIEHDPPRENPVTTKHIVDNPEILIVHVTHFNRLMWDNNRTPTTVIEHGVMIPKGDAYTGEIPKGIVMVNNISSEKRGTRRMGYDVFQQVREHIPLDIIGMGSKEIGGLGEIPYNEVSGLLGKYCFFFNPIRYTSLGLSVCEAMLLGMPVIGLATTEMATLGTNGETSFVETNVEKLIAFMQSLIDDKTKAEKMGELAKIYAAERFGIDRFTRGWKVKIEDHIRKYQENSLRNS